MKKETKLILTTLILLTFVSITVAATWIWSESITIIVNEYILSLTVDNSNPLKNQNITFSGTLTKNGIAVSDATIHLYRNDTAITTNITDANGNYMFIYNCTEKGPFTFKTGYQL